MLKNEHYKQNAEVKILNVAVFCHFGQGNEQKWKMKHPILHKWEGLYNPVSKDETHAISKMEFFNNIHSVQAMFIYCILFFPKLPQVNISTI